MSTNEFLRQLDPENLARLGTRQIAYVKQVEQDDGARIFELHAADGATIALFNNRDAAIGVCQQNDMQALSVH